MSATRVARHGTIENPAQERFVEQWEWPDDAGGATADEGGATPTATPDLTHAMSRYEAWMRASGRLPNTINTQMSAVRGFVRWLQSEAGDRRPEPPPIPRPETTPTAILIGCVASKAAHAKPARDLYTSPLFERRRAYAEARDAPWFVYSAKYGLMDPDTTIEPYDLTVADLPTVEQQALGERVASALEERFGPLDGRAFEIHAGEHYVGALAPHLEARGARLDYPLRGLRVGQQLHWYDTEAAGPGELPPPPSGDVDEPPELLDVERIGPFEYRWPVGTESYSHGWTFRARFAGREYRLRHGVARREAYGRERLRTVTWIGGWPSVEGVEADDYAVSGSLISLIRATGAGAMAGDARDLPRGYEGFEIVRYSDEIRAKWSRRGLAVKLDEADLLGWARHAILRQLGRERLVPPIAVERPRGPDPHQPAPTPGGVADLAAVRANQTRVVEAMLEYGAEADMSAGPEPMFTPNPEANEFVKTDAFAFLVAVILDQGIKAERAWNGPYLLRERLEHLDPVRIVANPKFRRELSTTERGSSGPFCLHA
jgi:hypothetical protein